MRRVLMRLGLHGSGGWPGALAFATVFAVATALIAAAPAFTESVGDVLARTAVAGLPDDEPAVTLQGFARFGPGTGTANDAAIATLAGVPGLRDPVATLAVGSPESRAQKNERVSSGRAVLLAREGAVAALDIIAEGGPDDGAYISQIVADELGAVPGDELVLADRVSRVPIRVRGIYRDIDGIDPGPYWNRIPRELLPLEFRVFGGLVQPQLLVTEPNALVAAFAESTIREDLDVDDMTPGELAQGRVWWQAFVGVDIAGVNDLRDLAAGVRSWDRSAQDPFTPLGGSLAAGGVTGLTLRTPMYEVAADVEDAIDRVEPSVRSVAIAAGAVGLVVVGLGAWFVARRRRIELRIWAVEGLSPLLVGAGAGLGAAPAAFAGSVGGLVLGPLMVQMLGPSSIAHPEVRPVSLVLGYAVLGLAAVAMVTALIAHRSLEERRLQRRWAWDLALYGIAAALVAQAVVRNGAGADPAELDLVTLLVPIAGIAAAVAAGIRLMAVLLGRARHGGRGLPVAALLAWRRAGAALGTRFGVVLPVGIAVGIALFSSVLVASVDAALDAKASVLVGGDIAVQISGPPLSEELPDGATLVRTGTASLQSDRRAWLVVIDPNGYRDAVGWHDSFGMSVDDFLGALAPQPGTSVPAVVAGPGAESIAGEEAARFQRLVIPFRPVATAEALPMMGRLGPTVAIRTDALAAFFGEDPDMLLTGTTRHVVASSAAGDIAATLQSEGQVVRNVQTRADVAADPAFSAQRWAFDFLGLVGLAAVVLSFAVFGFAIAEGRRRMVIAEALTARMGAGRSVSAVALALEIGALTGTALVMGGAAASLIGWLVLDGFDPLPAVRPLLAIEIPVIDGLVVAAIGGLLAVATWTAARWAARSADIAEVLRG